LILLVVAASPSIGAADESFSAAVVADEDPPPASLPRIIVVASTPLVRSDLNRDQNDITGIGQRTNNNGLFPTTPGYDLATGIGSPKMNAIITGFP